MKHHELLEHLKSNSKEIEHLVLTNRNCGYHNWPKHMVRQVDDKLRTFYKALADNQSITSIDLTDLSSYVERDELINAIIKNNRIKMVKLDVSTGRWSGGGLAYVGVDLFTAEQALKIVIAKPYIVDQDFGGGFRHYDQDFFLVVLVKDVLKINKKFADKEITLMQRSSLIKEILEKEKGEDFKPEDYLHEDIDEMLASLNDTADILIGEFETLISKQEEIKHSEDSLAELSKSLASGLEVLEAVIGKVPDDQRVALTKTKEHYASLQKKIVENTKSISFDRNYRIMVEKICVHCDSIVEFIGHVSENADYVEKAENVYAKLVPFLVKHTESFEEYILKQFKGRGILGESLVAAVIGLVSNLPKENAYRDRLLLLMPADNPDVKSVVSRFLQEKFNPAHLFAPKDGASDASDVEVASRKAPR